MSDTSSTPTAGGTVSLPAGVSIIAQYEGPTVDGAGNMVSGMTFTLKIPTTDGNFAYRSVFVADSLLTNVPLVQNLFAQRVAEVQAIWHP